MNIIIKLPLFPRQSGDNLCSSPPSQHFHSEEKNHRWAQPKSLNVVKEKVGVLQASLANWRIHTLNSHYSC